VRGEPERWHGTSNGRKRCAGDAAQWASRMGSVRPLANRIRIDTARGRTYVCRMKHDVATCFT